MDSTAKTKATLKQRQGISLLHQETSNYPLASLGVPYMSLVARRLFVAQDGSCNGRVIFTTDCEETNRQNDSLISLAAQLSPGKGCSFCNVKSNQPVERLSLVDWLFTS